MKVSAIIPAYNEEKTIRSVIETAKKSNYIYEIIVVDDGSVDKTRELALEAGAKVVTHRKNMGKGRAIKTGISKSSGDILVFLDADINWKHRKIEALVEPILRDEADFVKSSFTRKRGRLTELLVKPLIKTIFSGIEFSQPLSGQFAGKKEFFKTLSIEDKWGIDIGILLDAIKQKQRIKEVNIGTIIHKKRPLEDLIVTGEDVVKTIFKKAAEMEEFLSFDARNLVAEGIKGVAAFDLDGTLINGSSIEYLAKRFGFKRRLDALRLAFKRCKIKEQHITTELAKCLKGIKKSYIEKVCEHITLKRNVQAVIRQLKKRGYVIVIISSAFSPVVEYFAKKLDADEFYCPRLLEHRDKYTGEVDFSDIYDEDCCQQSVCKRKVLERVAKNYGIRLKDTIAVGDSPNDICMIKSAGTGIAIKGSRKLEKISDAIIYDLSEVLLYTH